MTVQTFLLEDDAIVPMALASGSGLGESYRVEGAISLTVESTTLLSERTVDFIVQLWESVVYGLGRELPFTTYYPDQSFDIRVEEVEPRRNVRHLKMTTGAGRDACAEAVVAWDEFYTAIAQEAQAFFARMQAIHPRGASEYARELERAVSLGALAEQYDARLHRPSPS